MSDSPMLRQEKDDSPMLGGEDWEGDVCKLCGKHILESDNDYICDEDGIIWYCSDECADSAYQAAMEELYDYYVICKM